MQKSEYINRLDRADYERLINRGFRIVRWNQRKNTIEITNKKGTWSWMADYSEGRWSEIVSNEKTLVE